MRRASLLLSLLLVACGARSGLHDEDPPDGGAGTDAGTPCARLAEVWCARLARCAPEAVSLGLTGGRAVGADRCVARVTLACEGWRAALPAAGDRIEACGAELTAASCGEVGWRYFDDGPPCGAWPRGARAVGAACRYDAQCASGDCTSGSTRACGVCRATVVVPTQRRGEACDARRQCQYWLACEGGVCVERGAAGASCSGDFDCDPSQGLACHRTERRCIPRPVAAAGGPCLAQIVTDPALPASARCGERQTCLNRNDFGQGQCRALLEDGAACMPFSSACAYPARCDDGRCVLPAALACAP